ncbi:hypothetical protein FDP41_001255 [Naegleria fowleri]|uniref:SHSP domain-containing protein n=1 Tax=Naegleria fowleri TaxID=5763 RepID=A0A6A5BR09_NAEFO|nr:uncharacterized protein FDP41_001413 [Naegleria fowleri]XP_044564300.1 uncharacterized protein FDP41_001255 [Naegleria fowleri]KAF0979549.1 hypothetical protein FDP41_001413 [Naegleria fowleri]KAF0979587.1 hypothetical protein FDP41_001255 [Naegleria fowleri]CAG4716400.1 unnamed protein product [Naegleria fowleri]
MSLVKRLFGSSPHQHHTFRPIRSRNPLYNFLSSFTDNDIVQPLVHSPFSTFNSPLVDVKESPTQFELIADVPGFKKENIHCTIDEETQTLILQGDKESKEEKDSQYILHERFNVGFSRQFDIPDNVKIDEIKASIKDGQLRLIIPKSESYQPHPVHSEKVKNIQIEE